MSEMRVAAFSAHFGAMHVERIIFLLDDQIFRDRFAESWSPRGAVELVERTKKRFASDDVDINSRVEFVPKGVFKRGFGAVLARDVILVALQSRPQHRIARDRTVRIESDHLFGHRVTGEGEVNDHTEQESGDAEPDAQADS